MLEEHLWAGQKVRSLGKIKTKQTNLQLKIKNC